MLGWKPSEILGCKPTYSGDDCSDPSLSLSETCIFFTTPACSGILIVCTCASSLRLMRYFLLESNSFNKPLLLNDQSYACTLTHIHITSSDYICPIIRGFFGCTHRLSSCNCCRNVFGLKVKDHWPKPRVLDTLPILASILGYICFEALSYRRNHFQDFLGRISRQTVQMKLVYEILCGFYRSQYTNAADYYTIKARLTIDQCTQCQLGNMRRLQSR